ncbi:uncharacterized protein LAESUDRAFT_763666 [Laetiporus sulphureus 93-53]|uniref:Uncharacterized protein n=1 Tax=Laetiporus sulphureus 93-53 TaxID=1314785 RepID=A0A165BRZ8_9APHY|nr:uncharacterized protein LAESUDRAFT_763666 [Laetiporus sulphureus 93-53]KZT01544.1 hypothetical protein LAESUDRAFT_763666 [Laetiporus sulphureus 93-53]
MSAAAVANISLCDKPKYDGHKFCGRTCATQATQGNLCIQCNKRPRFGNHDYCGKTCAAQAQAKQKPTAARVNVAFGTPIQGTANSAARARGQASLVASQDLNRSFSSEDDSGDDAEDDPVIPPMNVSEGHQSPLRSTTSASPTAAQAPAICAIPDCNEPVYVDPAGLQTSEYCSTKHREYVFIAVIQVAAITQCLVFCESEKP